eukprot:TRINITY_DN1450_c0_g1_i1.p1 TRINITY_DN1450_c0_g1~~TRINITY_DN1450_c0_g1_i1.p1  ORF type:complete len:356 (+),score=100.11 TRINITY_DN1450_c0_g1_i1:568-1635(+)
MTILDVIHKLKDSRTSRANVKKILVAIVRKFESLSRVIPRLVKTMSNGAGRNREKEARRTSGHRDRSSTSATIGKSGNKKEEEEPQILDRRPETPWIPAEKPKDEETYPEKVLAHIKELLLFMYHSLKNVVWYLYAISKSKNGNAQIEPEQMETHLMGQLMEYSLECIPAFSLERQKNDDKLLLDYFTYSLYVMEPDAFKRVISVKIETFFNKVVEYEKPPLIIVAKNLLVNPRTSRAFADVLLSFLIEHMDWLAAPHNPTDSSKKDGGADAPKRELTEEEAKLSRRSEKLYLLTKLVFTSFQFTQHNHPNFSIDNTKVLRPYLSQIVTKCIKFAKKKKYRLRGRSSETAKAHRG